MICEAIGAKLLERKFGSSRLPLAASSRGWTLGHFPVIEESTRAHPQDGVLREHLRQVRFPFLQFLRAQDDARRVVPPYGRCSLGSGRGMFPMDFQLLFFPS